MQVQHKYCMKLSQCVELEEAFFCIFCVGNVLYFVTAYKKQVYHYFIFLTNITEDHFVLVFFFFSMFCVQIHPQYAAQCSSNHKMY